MKTIKAVFFCLLLVLLHNCGSSPIISTPEENIDNIPLKISNLSESELKKWSHLDLIKDTIPGISLEKAYNWVGSHFNPKDATTEAMLRGLKELQSTNVAPELPDISGSLSSLKTYLRQMQALRAEG